MRINNVDITSFIYFGGYDKGTELIGKIGETKRALQEREQDIRDKSKNSDYHMYAFALLTNVTQAQRRQVESDMRAGMEKFGINIGNDHIKFPKVAKKNRHTYYKVYAFLAMLCAIESCERNGFKYHVEWAI